MITELVFGLFQVFLVHNVGDFYHYPCKDICMYLSVDG